MLRVVLLLGLASSLMDCGSRPAPRPVRAAPSAAFAPPSQVPMRWEGRIDPRDPAAPRFAWPASGFRLRFHGSRVAARLDDALFEDVIRDPDLLAVFVDGEAPRTLPLREGAQEVVLAQGLRPGEHELRVLKRTESEAGAITLRGLSVDGRWLPAPPARPHALLAIGDSITAGYGIDGPDARCHYSAGTSNATRTYTFLAAQALDAEYQAVAWSGRGVYRNLDPTLPERVPELYPRLLATELAPFDARTFVPDVVVVNLGTNDLVQPRPEKAPFLEAYRGLLDRLRADAPRAYVVLAVGPMLADDYPPRSMALSKARRWVSGLVDERRTAGDARISFLELYGASPDEGYGCDYHPSFRTHQRLAEALVAHLRAIGAIH